MFRGLRLRLTLLYVLAALAFVAVLSISTYHLLATYFQATTDMGLQHKMAHEFRLLGAPVPPELAAADRDWFANRAILFPDATPMAGAVNMDYADEMYEEYEAYEDDEHEGDDYYEAEDYAEEFYDGELSAIFVLPLDAQGRLLFDPNPYTPPLPPNTAAVEAALEQGHDWRTITLANDTPVRLLTYRLTRDDGPAVLQLGRALIDQQRILSQLVLILLGVGSASVVVLGAGSWWLAGRAIVPAQQAWARQQAFVANASHELRTPLALIRASAEAAQRRLASDTARSQELLADIVSESDHTTALVNDLLLLSRLDSGRLELAPEPLELPTFLGDLTRQAQPLAEERSITLAADEVRGSVLADPSRLHQVVLIVLDNALRHTPPGGTITLHATSDGKQVTIAVQDTGSGIPAADLPHVFERFYRGAEARAEGGGSGLGLAIARALMEAMQGRITLESTEGQGTTVTLVLPAA
jgi:signal transduction histidine kinase